VAETRIAGVLDIDLPPDAKVLTAAVRLEDVTQADRASRIVAQQYLNSANFGKTIDFDFTLDSTLINPACLYILTVQVDVNIPKEGGRWRFGVTQSYPWVNLRSRPSRLVVKRLYALGEDNGR
jgi:uncharacterized lipoprotein YbaY